LGYTFSGKFPLNHATLVIASSILTASMASLLLGTIMIMVILLSKRFRINPDNVATPVAGILGDVVTLGMLPCLSSMIFNEING
jgi:solute carrier family 41